MTAVGIICEYNPFHYGHYYHIQKTKELLGKCGVVCVMSGNFTQRGDFAVFAKHARAEAAVICGADLVVEMPSAYALSSAEGFAEAGVRLLDALGICSHISFGSESGDILPLARAAEAIVTEEAEAELGTLLGTGLSYASACQKAAEAVLGDDAAVFRLPNNLLGIEYLKAIAKTGAALTPATVRRDGGEHDGSAGWSASAVRLGIISGDKPWESVPPRASVIYRNEIREGRGPVTMELCEQAILSRLRFIKDFSKLPGAVEGLDRRFARFAVSEATVAGVLDKVKTKRYSMSRLRRMLLCACLGIQAKHVQAPPPYIRVLAMNAAGMSMLRRARGRATLPVITKPAAAKALPENAADMFRLEAEATDFYSLAMPESMRRSGGGEYRESPRVVVV